MKNNLFIIGLLLGVALASCQREPRFEVSGMVEGADGQVLYLERLALEGTQVADSCLLKGDGTFRFRPSAKNNPELYRLRIGKRQLVLAVDSMETISLATPIEQLAYAAVTGSVSTERLTALRRSIATQTPDEHKQLAREYILQDPRSLVAYYALFQQRDGEPVFDLYEEEDRTYYAAVATAWHTFLPENSRSKALYNLVTDVIKTERQLRNREIMQNFIEQSESAFLDIELPDETGETRRLSDLRGQVILLDFSAVGMQQGNAYIFELRELYNRYHNKGLEIYSVSADSNRLLWEESAQNLPWVTVRGEEGDMNAFLLYNVQVVPTMFLFDRKGQIVNRYTGFENLPKDIEACLR